MIHRFLSGCDWARGMTFAGVERAVRNSLSFGVYRECAQVGFGRVITDRATFAYLADVFILPPHRGIGLARRLVREILAHPELQGVRRFLLSTRDAHALYARLGFVPLDNPGDFMTIRRPRPARSPGSETS